MLLLKRGQESVWEAEEKETGHDYSKQFENGRRGFGGNTNVVTVITEDFEKELGKLTKEETADRILDQILAQRGEV